MGVESRAIEWLISNVLHPGRWRDNAAWPGLFLHVHCFGWRRGYLSNAARISPKSLTALHLCPDIWSSEEQRHRAWESSLAMYVGKQSPRFSGSPRSTRSHVLLAERSY